MHNGPVFGGQVKELLAQQEKALQGHHILLVSLQSHLEDAGWTEIEEIPAAIDLWARRPDGKRVIFEAKTLQGNELHQLRSGLAQLLEYRYFHGNDNDRLCLVVDRPIPDRLSRFLEHCGVSTVWMDGSSFYAAGASARDQLQDLIQ